MALLGLLKRRDKRANTESAVRPAPGRVLWPRRTDALRDYPATGLTPQRLTSILREADAGSPSAAMQLFEEMEEKDAHLFAVASKRRLALTGLPWSIVSAAEAVEGLDRARADETASYCRDALARLDAFDDVLAHLAMALGRNVAVAELVWEADAGGLRLADLVPVDFTRLAFDEFGAVRVLTDEVDIAGLPAVAPKFIVHTPHSASGHPSRGGLLRVSALAFLGKNLALKDWLIFAEIFGMPVRVARYDASATAEEKQEMLRMLESLGSNAAGIFSRAVELQFVEAGQGKAPPPYEHLVDFLNREMSKAWLGQTLTTETPGLGGSFGATKIHEEVRKDLRADDLRKEARMLRRGLLAPLVRLRFGPDAPVPYFQRAIDQPRTASQLAELLDVAVNKLGLRVPQRWAHEALALPSVSGNDPVVAGRAQNP
jgi:phage gp29-like protein